MTQDEINQLNTIINSTDDPAAKLTSLTQKLSELSSAPAPAPAPVAAIIPVPEEPEMAPAMQVKEWVLKYGFFILGILAFAFDITTVFLCKNMTLCSPGLITAFGFVFLVLGLVFYFPDIINEGDNGPSTMRVVVLVIVLIFAFVYVKAARETGTLANLKIDQSWIYVLGLAFGSKVFQKFAEKS